MLFFLTCLFIVPLVLTAPLVVVPRDNNDNTNTLQPTNLTNAQISPLILPAKFARAAYCSSASLQNLSCGEPCNALGGNIRIVHTGGDNGAIPGFFIAEDRDNRQMVVSHQGTNPHNVYVVITLQYYITIYLSLSDLAYLLQTTSS